jgi:protein-S-isoprenylcysteine O-methyltransferase Ste14
VIRDWPIALLTLTIWAYWGTVFLLVLYRRVRYGERAGVFPRKRREKRLWLAVVPVFAAWNTVPAVAAVMQGGVFGLPAWGHNVPVVFGVRAVAASVAVACYLVTLYCWLLMGRNWSIAIVPGQQSALVTRGIFGVVRHPIYSLSIMLMLCSVVVTCSPLMVLLAMTHITVLNLKSRREEDHLLGCHGPTYAAYCAQVGRFFPRLRTPA